MFINQKNDPKKIFVLLKKDLKKKEKLKKDSSTPQFPHERL